MAIILILIAFPAGWCRKLSERVKLPNFGDTLKLLVPSYSWKTISGSINNWCKVISQKMSENEMGYRVSKSDKIISVKEQRVDGSSM